MYQDFLQQKNSTPELTRYYKLNLDLYETARITFEKYKALFKFWYNQQTNFIKAYMLTGTFAEITTLKSLKKKHIPLIHDLITMKEFESLFYYWGLNICEFDSKASNIFFNCFFFIPF